VSGLRVKIRKLTLRFFGALLLLGVLLAVTDAFRLLAGLTGAELKALLLGALATSLRVFCALVIGTAWTVPAGFGSG